MKKLILFILIIVLFVIIPELMGFLLMFSIFVDLINKRNIKEVKDE
jgi:hypothetical protein